MEISLLPKLVERFVRALEAGHSRGLKALLRDADIVADGCSYKGAAVAEWVKHLAPRASDSIRILDPRWKSGAFHFTAQVEDRKSGARSMWRGLIQMADDKILGVELSSRYQLDLPETAERLIDAINRGDRVAALSLFADRAVVNDELVDYRGEQRIGDWMESNVIANRLCLIAVEIHAARHSIIVTTRAFGDFPQEGLPNPLVLNLYFALAEGKIEHLVFLQCPFAPETFLSGAGTGAPTKRSLPPTAKTPQDLSANYLRDFATISMPAEANRITVLPQGCVET